MPQFGEAVVTSLRRRSKKIADNTGNNNPLFMKMKKVGNILTGETGRTLFEEHDFDENGTIKRYAGSETLNIAEQVVFDAFEYNWKQTAGAIRFNGLEGVQNGGDSASIKLLKARLKNLERSIKNSVHGDMYSDGTADSGKQIGGLDLLIAEDPTTGTVGGVNRATAGNEYARNQVLDNDAAGAGSATTATNIESRMRSLQILTERGGDTNRIWLLGNTYWQAFVESGTTRQRYVDKELLEMGFVNAKLDGVTVCLGGGFKSAASSAASLAATKGYLVNADYLKLRVGKGRYFAPLDSRPITDADSEVQYLAFCGNMTCCNFQLQSVMFD